MISIDKVHKNYINKTTMNTVTEKAQKSEASTGSFDEIVISSANKRIGEEKQAVEGMAKSVIGELKQSTDSGKLKELERRISEGSYKVDADRLAAKIIYSK